MLGAETPVTITDQAPEQHYSRCPQSSNRRSRRKHGFAPSPHLELRLSLVETQSEDEDRHAEDRQQTLGIAETTGLEKLVLCAAGDNDPSADAANQQPIKHSSLPSEMQPPLHQHHQRSALLHAAIPAAQQQAHQQQVVPASEVQDDTIPATPESARSADDTSACDAAGAVPAGSDMVPGTPDDDQRAAEETMPSLKQHQPQQAQQDQQQQEHEQQVLWQQLGQQQLHHLDFQFPKSAHKAAADVTPTLKFRSFSRTAGEQAPQAVLDHAAAAELSLKPSSPDLTAGQQQAHQVVQKNHLGQTIPNLAFQTPAAAVRHKQTHGPAATQAGTVSVTVVGRTPSTRSKAGVSPSDSDMLCALLDSYERKQPTKAACTAAIAVASRTAMPGGSADVATRAGAASSSVQPTNVPGATAAAAQTGLGEQSVPISGDDHKQERKDRLLRWLDGLKQDTPVRQAAHALQVGQLLSGPQQSYSKQLQVSQQQEQRPQQQQHQQQQQQPIQQHKQPEHAQPPQQLRSPHGKKQHQQQQQQQPSRLVKKPLPLQQVPQQGTQVLQQQPQQQLAQQGQRLKLAPPPPTASASNGHDNHMATAAAATAGVAGLKSSAVLSVPSSRAAGSGASASVATAMQLLSGDRSPAAAFNAVALASHQPPEQCEQRQQQQGEQHMPSVSPAGQSDRSAGSNSRPSSAGGLTPNTLAALDALEEQYMQQKQHTEQVPQQHAGGAVAVPQVVSSTGTSQQVSDGCVQAAPAGISAQKPPRPPMPALQTALAAPALQSNITLTNASNHNQHQQLVQHVPQHQQPAKQLQQLPVQQQQVLQHEWPAKQDPGPSQAAGIADSPTAKRCRYQEEQQRQQQHQKGAVSSCTMQADSPLPAKVLFGNLVLDSTCGQQQAHEQQQALKQQQQQQGQGQVQQRLDLATLTTVAGQQQQLLQQQQQAVAAGLVQRQHGLVKGQPEAAGVFDVQAIPTQLQHEQHAVAAAAAAQSVTGVTAHEEEESSSSSESDDDDAAAGYISSQAAAMARIMRKTRKLEQNRQQQLQQERQQQWKLEAQQLASQLAARRVERLRRQSQGLTQAAAVPAASTAAVTGTVATDAAKGVDLDGDDDDSDSGEDYKLEMLLKATQAPRTARATQPAAAESPGEADTPGVSPASAKADADAGFLLLESYLPPGLADVYRGLGMTRDLYQWQAECLNQPGVLDGRNLVYCAPTSGGKSLVAEIIMLRRLLTTGRPALLVLPYVALCTQKAAHLQRLLTPLGKEVRSLYGGMGGAPLAPNTGVIVCTIEKANIVVNKMLEDDTLGHLGSVVVDELHMVGDDDRGYLLELLLTKLRFATQAAKEADERRKAEAEQQLERYRQMTGYQQDHQSAKNVPGTPANPLMSGQSTPDLGSDSQVQIIGMSATLPNVDQAANWLDAVLYQTDFRPVELKQMIKIDNVVRDKSGQVMRQLEIPSGWDPNDKDHVALLTKETIDAGHSVLVFCCSKVQCEVTAKFIAKLLTIPERLNPSAQPPGDPETPGGVPSSARAAVVAELSKYKGSEGSSGLKEVVARGVAWHHSGLNGDQRHLVEKAFGSGAVSVLCATSTVAAGVNMPVRRVIFKHSYIGQPTNPLDPTRYMQMSGRAGRAGIDSEGESILIANRGNIDQLVALMNAGSTPISSCLVETRRGMKRAMLEVVAAGVVSSSPDVERYLKCSLLAAIEDYKNVAVTSTQDALKWLESKKFLEWNRESGSWGPTDLGKATAASGLNPDQALLVKRDLENARMGLCLATDLHLTYLVTPVHDLLDLQRHHWEILYDILNRARGPIVKVIEFVGLSRNYVHQRRMGVFRTGLQLNEKQLEDDRVARRFYAALVIVELISNDKEPSQVAQEYALAMNVVEGLQERTGAFAHTMTSFCERYHWTDLEALISKFQSRVCHGVTAELVALTEIPYVKGVRAKVLYKAGLRTPEAVAAADEDRLLEVLLSGAPNAGSGKDAAQQRKKEKKAARMIAEGARALVAAKARELEEQSEALRAAAAGGTTAGTPGTAAATPAGLALPKSPLSASRFRTKVKQQQQQKQASPTAHRAQGRLAQQAGTVQQDPQQQQRSQQLMPPPPPRQPQDQAIQQPQQQINMPQVQQKQPPEDWKQSGPRQQLQEQQWQQQESTSHQGHLQQAQPLLQQQQQSAIAVHQQQQQQCGHFSMHQHQHHQQQPAQAPYPVQAGNLDQQQQQQLFKQPHRQQQHLAQSLPLNHVQQQQWLQPEQHPGFQQLPQHPQQNVPHNDQLQHLHHQQQQQQQLLVAPSLQAGHEPHGWHNKRSHSPPDPGEHPAKRLAGQTTLAVMRGAAALAGGGSSSGVLTAIDAAGSGTATAAAVPAAASSTAIAYPAAAAASKGWSGPVTGIGSGAGHRYTAAGSVAGVSSNVNSSRGADAVRSGGLASCSGGGVPAGRQPQQQQQQEVHKSGEAAGTNTSATSWAPSSTDDGTTTGRTYNRPPLQQHIQLQQSAPSVSVTAGTADTKSAAVDAIQHVRTAVEMKQLEAKLLAAPYWGFAVSLNSDAGPIGAAAGALQGPEWKVPDPRARHKTSETISAAGAGGSVQGSDDDAHTQQQQQHSIWSWNVLGVAFSLGDCEAYYVSLLSSGKSSKLAGLTEVTQRYGTSPRLQQLWDGIRRILTTSSGLSAGRSGGIPAVCAAGKAINGALAAARDAGVTTLAVPPEAAPKHWLDPGPVKVTYALKHQLALLAQPPAASGFDGFVVCEPVVDVRLAAWLLEPDNESLLGEDVHGLRPGQKPLSKGLEELLKKWAGPKGVKEAVGGLSNAGEAARRAVPACKKACMALKLHKLLVTMLHGEALIPVLMGMEMPIAHILAAMEAEGIAISAKAMLEQKPAMQKRLRQLEIQAYQHNFGLKFNLASAADVRTVLFDRLKLPPPPCATIKSSKNLSTKAEVLEELASQHGLPRIIIQHRKLTKICTSFLDPLVSKVVGLQKAQARAAKAAAQLGHSSAVKHSALVPAGPTADHVQMDPEAATELVRISGTFLQTNTSTGRLSMEEPSLQTIPRPLDYELAITPTSQNGATATGDGAQLMQQQQVNIRAAFVAPPGCVLLSADYGQIELRLMAHFSGDPHLLAALATPDDPFKELAARWRKCNVEQVTADMRNQAKRIAYGLLYGMGPAKLAVDLECSIPEAYALADGFKRSHEGLSAWIKDVIDSCHTNAWVTTISGRRRYLPHIRGKGEQTAQAERQAVNTVCQGSAADIVKGVMIELIQQLEDLELSKYCRLLLQVHDELLFEVSERHLAAAASQVRRVMEAASQTWGLKVRLPVKLSVGPSWGELQEYEDHQPVQELLCG